MIRQVGKVVQKPLPSLRPFAIGALSNRPVIRKDCWPATAGGAPE
jgi:hypothetical protein